MFTYPMGRTVATHLAATDGTRVNPRLVYFVFQRFSRTGRNVALLARRVVVWLVQLGRSMIGIVPIIGIVVPYVVHPADFGDHQAEHTVVGVARVAALVTKPLVFAVLGCKSRALRALGVGRVRNHHVTRTAKFPFLCHFEVGHVARHGGRDG